MEGSEAALSQSRPQRIIGSKHGYYKVSYLSANPNVGVLSKPPEWVPKHQVSNELVLTWRNQRSQRMAFIQKFKLKKGDRNNQDIQAISTPTSAQINTSIHEESSSTPLSKTTNAQSTVPHSEVESSQIGSMLNSKMESVQPHGVKPVSSEEIPESATSQQEEIEPIQTLRVSEQPEASYASKNLEISRRANISELPSVPTEHASFSAASGTGHDQGSSESLPMSSEPVNPSEEASTIQTQRGGVFQAVRHAAHAALGVFTSSQSEVTSSQPGAETNETVPSDTNQRIVAQSEPYVSNESSVHPSLSQGNVLLSQPLSQEITVQKTPEDASQNNITPNTADNSETSSSKTTTRVDDEARYVSRSGRRIRPPISTTNDPSNDTMEALNAKIMQQAEEIKFLKSMYEDASNSATRLTEELGNAKEQIRLLKDQLTEGLNAQRNLHMSEVKQWKQEAERAKQQLLFLELREQQVNDDIRRKAAEWDKHVEQDRRDTEFREKRWKEWDQRKQREGLVFESVSTNPTAQDSLSEELAELAAEANEASNTEQPVAANDQPRSSRRRAAATAVGTAEKNRDAPMRGDSSGAVVSTADSGVLLNPMPSRDTNMPEHAQDATSQDILGKQINQHHVRSAEKRTYETQTDSIQTANPQVVSPSVFKGTSTLYSAAATPLPSFPSTAMTQDRSDPTLSTVPRWKRRRQ